MTSDEVQELLAAQDGVLSRRQLRELAVTDADIERSIRRREWARIFDGVYVNHTGPLTWNQRAWAAVLFCWPAALSGGSALQAFGVRSAGRADDDVPIQVCIDAARSVRRRRDIRVTQVRDWTAKCHHNLSPPRLRLEHALIGEAARARREDAAVAVLADGVQRGRTTVDRLVSALEQNTRLRHRGLLLEILHDVQSGAYSALERRYLARVERAHGLPTGSRQRRVKPGRRLTFRDVDYLEQCTVVELDGRLGHEEALDRWADLERDLASTIAGDVTLRVGWKQVLDPCRLARLIARILQSNGWRGSPVPCGPRCGLDDDATDPAPRA